MCGFVDCGDVGVYYDGDGVDVVCSVSNAICSCCGGDVGVMWLGVLL